MSLSLSLPLLGLRLIPALSGVNFTLPFTCYTSSSERSAQAPPYTRGNSSDVALGHNFVSAAVSAQHCLRTAGDRIGLIGTAYVARDMIRIVDALDEDGLLRFWGVSYGTILGATVSAMFPERVDRVVLDSNVNAQQYYTGLWVNPGPTMIKANSWQ